ncbi:MAG: amino acid transporter [Microbacterium sp.]|uniref:amino acid transporter n=1 Tax=Microbacterium sp. TaxID=51671 RepID=UPI0039E30117
MTDKPTRRELMRPVQLLGLAFGAALFAGIVTAVSMGAFQSAGQVAEGELTKPMRALMVGGVVAGIAFIVTLVTIALLILAVDPAQVRKQIDRPVLLDDPDDQAGDAPDSPGPARSP